MSNPVLTKEDIAAIAEQFENLENSTNNIRVNSLTVGLAGGASATFTRAREEEWQVTLGGQPDHVLGGYRDR